MSFFQKFSLGFDAYGDAHRFIVRHKLWGYVLFPGLINLALFIGTFLLGYYTGGLVVERIFEWLGISGESEGFVRILVSALHFFIRIAVYIALFLLYLSTYKYIVLILMTPVLIVLSEKVYGIMTGRSYKFVFKLVMLDIARGTGIILRNLCIELGFILIFFFLSFIPVIGFICPFILFIISMYFLGFSMMYYSQECYRLKIKQSVHFIRKNKGFAIANGFVFYLLLLIPLLGLMIAPSYAVVAATLGVDKLKQTAR
jgi:CysZ protein